jgi:hypothetical protein
MTSVIKVDNIQNSTGTAAISIDGSGQVSMPNTVEIDQWYLTATFSTNNATITGWARQGHAFGGYAGTGMTESSGVFTFPSTGLWRVSGNFLIVAGAGDTSCGFLTQVSSNSGSSYTNIGGVFESQNTNTSGSFQQLINVTNASTYRFKLEASGLNASSNILGQTDLDYSALMFERITDAQ